VREPGYWHYFFWVEHIQRFLSPDKAQHPQPFWFYVPILLGGAMPWTPLAGPIIVGLRHVGTKDPMVRLAVCWLVMPLALFSASSGRLGTYILPCFPPLAFLIAIGLTECLRLDVEQFVRLSAQNPGKTCVTPITTAKLYGEYRRQLPKPAFENVSQGLAFAQFGPIRANSNGSPTP
jgi:4-amino-4-deoxy-L-arabinose transferase-like glycosyltransferase